MFTIYKRFVRKVPVYKLKDDAGEILEGTFYEAELQKVIKEYDVYRVGKVLRKGKRKGEVEYFVKWKGYPDKFKVPLRQNFSNSLIFHFFKSLSGTYSPVEHFCPTSAGGKMDFVTVFPEDFLSAIIESCSCNPIRPCCFVTSFT